MAWIGAKMKGIESSYDDLVNGLKESYYTNIQNSLCIDNNNSILFDFETSTSCSDSLMSHCS